MIWLNEKNWIGHITLWYRKIQYLLNEVNVLETIINVMEQAIEGNIVDHQHDTEAYYLA